MHASGIFPSPPLLCSQANPLPSPPCPPLLCSQAKVPNKETKLVVACQKGLRSLASCEQLSTAGYQSIAWINGGFDSCGKDSLPTPQNTDLR